MPYFSRLTDIVTCSLTDLLRGSADPETALIAIIGEMEAGIVGAERCMRTASRNESRLHCEIDEQRRQIGCWVNIARECLTNQNESQARQALVRKHEVENLIAGLEMQLKAAAATREHLTTTYHALEARLADARRRLTALKAGLSPTADLPPEASASASAAETKLPDIIDLELESLKRELEGN